MEQPYDQLIQVQVPHFVNYCLHGGAIVKYIPFNTRNSDWPGFCNPSIMWDEQDKEFKMILRNVNHLMHNSGKVWAREIRLLYSNPDKDNRNLKTQNWLGRCKDPINEDFEFSLITTTPYEPQWEFQGQEDGRILRWKGQLISTGVRRDDNTVGRGRMEVMFLDKDDEGDGYHQSFSAKVPAPGDDSTYCEKNWMPIQDQPYRYVRTSNPTQVISVRTMGETKVIIDKPKQELGELDKFDMIRGSSQVIPYKDGYIALVHTCELWLTANERKVARYLHAFIMWDKFFNIVKVSPTFNFAGWDVEFSCGMEHHDGNFYIPFALNDNVPFFMVVPDNIMDRFIEGDELAPEMYKTPFSFWPSGCEMLNPAVDLHSLRTSAIDNYKDKCYAKSYAIFTKAFEMYDQFEDLFMMGRSVADLGGRNEHERSLWYKCIEMFPDRPEGYLALAGYYNWRGMHSEAMYWADLALKKLAVYNGPLVYYNRDAFLVMYNNTRWNTKDFMKTTHYLSGQHANKRLF